MDNLNSFTMFTLILSSHKVSEMTQVTSDPDYDDLFHPPSALAITLQGML